MIELRSPAKLNLMLHITGRRPDGYHNLQTLFQLIDLCDTMRFSATDDGRIELLGEVPGIAREQNIVLRAARNLLDHAAPGCGARIQLEKRIPVGGGLGGGSSNAATTLLALNRLWGCGLGEQELMHIGLALGADVPLFVFGRNAFAEGIGERLHAVDLPPRWYLLIHPGCAVNTAAIFNEPELTRNTPTMTIAALLRHGGHNDCEAVVRKRYPAVNQALAWLGEFSEARMSGTGSCVFSAFADEASARKLAREAPEEWQCFVTRGIRRSTVHEALPG